jgi:hypothetical protein
VDIEDAMFTNLFILRSQRNDRLSRRFEGYCANGSGYHPCAIEHDTAPEPPRAATSIIILAQHHSSEFFKNLSVGGSSAGRQDLKSFPPQNFAAQAWRCSLRHAPQLSLVVNAPPPIRPTTTNQYQRGLATGQ